VGRPGAGRSTDLPEPFGLDGYADCLAGFLAKLGLDTARVAGQSFGGILALALQRRHAARSRALILDYGHVLHDLQLSDWVLAWRRRLGETLIQWHGETEIHPPIDLRRDPRDPFLRVDFDSDQYVENLRDERPRLLRPDAIVEVEDSDAA
jgi:pimeloyl-ACP methyl ester carboxylesterase